MIALPEVPGPLSDGTAAFPPSPPRTGPLGEVIIENIAYSCEPGYRPLFLDLRVPNVHHCPLIVWVHGGGWLQGSRRRLPPNLFEHRLHDRMLQAGFAVAAVDYRLAREAPFPGMLLDLLAAIRWLRAHSAMLNLDPDRVAVWGESAGAHIALMLGLCTKLEGVPRTGEFLEASESLQAVVDWYGPAQFDASARKVGHPIEVMLRSSDWSLEDISPATYVRSDLPPLFIAHGAEDQTVPVEQSRLLFGKLRAVGATVDYLEVPGAGHVWVGAASVADVISKSLEFLNKALAQRPTLAKVRS